MAAIGAEQPPRGGLFAWWSRVFRFAVLGRLPTTPPEVPIWAICVPYRMWHLPKRYDGRTFGDSYSGRASAVARALVPYRGLYLAFLFLWPLVAAFRSLLRGRGALRHWRHALARPEMSMLFPKGDFSDREIAWMRPDYALSMFYAWEWHHRRPDFHAFDDKRVFLAAAEHAGLPLPTVVTVEEAIARGGTWYVKEPGRDLGYGIDRLTSEELRDEEDVEDLIVQEPLRMHPVLRSFFSETAPVSTLRVITTLDPDSGEPRITRCAVRTGRAGAVADNTAQGGIWANVDREAGTIGPGVTKKTFGVVKNGEPARVTAHPDTGKSFVGLRVPWFDEGCAMALEAHRRLAPTALSLGWDVALADERPVLFEVNVWTVCYDYDPPDDAFTPACRLILERLAQV